MNENPAQSGTFFSGNRLIALALDPWSGSGHPVVGDGQLNYLSPVVGDGRLNYLSPQDAKIEDNLHVA
jgi:hypothetical protein